MAGEAISHDDVSTGVKRWLVLMRSRRTPFLIYFFFFITGKKQTAQGRKQNTRRRPAISSLRDRKKSRKAIGKAQENRRLRELDKRQKKRLQKG